MRNPDRTDPGDDLLALGLQRLDLPDLPDDHNLRIDVDLALLAFMDEVRRELDVWEDAVVAELFRLGMTAKRCERCGKPFAVGGPSAHARFCSRQCQNQRS